MRLVDGEVSPVCYPRRTRLGVVSRKGEPFIQEILMTVKYSDARNRRTRYSNHSPSTTATLRTLPNYSPSPAEKAINWLSVVDDFKIRKHHNVFPRWSLLMIVLAVIAI